MRKICLLISACFYGVTGLCQQLKSVLPVNSSLQATEQSFTSSNLPVFLINTNYQQIPDDPKISARLGIIYNGPGARNNVYDDPVYFNENIGIELRGNSTQNYPKKPYAFETRDSLGQNLNIQLFEMPKENDWILLASYFDHTFIRTPLAFHMSRLTGKWASRCHLVELLLNSDYQGIYILTEKIKPDKGRLNISKLEPHVTSQPEITGGYIWEITGFENNLGQSRNLKYPDYNEAPIVQTSYIQQFDNAFREVMNSDYYPDKVNGYAAWIDVESFVDELLVQEAMRNSDAYGWSGYFHKDREGKIKAGPVWDFDQSAGNSSYPDDGVIFGWMFSHKNTSNTPFFWPKLFEDPVFSYKVRKRWEDLRKNEFKTIKLITYIDSIAGLLAEAQTREFVKWPVLGEYIWRETTGYQYRDTYQKEVNYLKDFLIQRWAWMDTELAKIKNPTSIKSYNSDILNDVLVYPNPAKDFVTFEIQSSEPSSVTINILNSLGIQVQPTTSFNSVQGENKFTIVLENIQEPGIYYYIIYTNDKEAFKGKIFKSN